MRRIILALTLLASCLGAAAGPHTVFPSDGENPAQAGGRELLEAVCPGHVASGKEVGCQIPCPAFTGFPGEDLDWSLSRVTRGHFLSPTSDDAALWMEGCESHAVNFGGTILLTRHANRWTMVWYKSGIVTAECHKVPLRSRRDILVCMAEEGGQGSASTALYVEDLRAPTDTPVGWTDNGQFQGEFFQVSDDTGACGWNMQDESKPYPLTRSYIEKVESSASAISVTAATGTRSMTPKDVKACLAEQSRNERPTFFPPTKSYRIDFLFDGHGYKIAPASAAAARIFQFP